MDARNLQDERPGEEKCRQHSGTALSLSGICRQFGTMQALNHVSLDVEPGEIICLVGHSGCGKTSLLRIIAGIDAPDSGTLTMGGKRSFPTVFSLSRKNAMSVWFFRIMHCFHT